MEITSLFCASSVAVGTVAAMILTTTVLFVCVGVQFVRGLRRRQSGRCVECGYDLTGLPVPRCPECGHGFPPRDSC